LWNKARAALTKDPPPEDSKQTLTLEVRPEEVKVLYARALALQSLVDGWLDRREIEYLYVFMSRVSMSSDSREEVRQTLATSGNLLKTGIIFGMNPLALNWAQLFALPPVTLAWIIETLKRNRSIRVKLDEEWMSTYQAMPRALT
jgi:hypothetical protein